MQLSPTNRKTRIVLSLLIYLVTALFIFISIQRIDFSKLQNVHINWFYLIIAIPFSVLSRVFLPYIWIKLISLYKHINADSEYWHLNYIYAKAWLGRYVPGNVAWVGGKIYFATERGISKTILGITSLIESGLQLLTALLVGVLFLFISGAYSNFLVVYNLFFLSSLLLGVLVLSPPIFNRILSRGYKAYKKKTLDKKYFISLSPLLKFAGMYLCIHLLSTLPIYLLVKAIGYDLSIIQLLYVSGAFIFAGAIGTLAVIAPSGIGIREGIILLFLTNVLPLEVSVALVIVLRLWSIALDIIYWLLSYLKKRFSFNKRQV